MDCPYIPVQSLGEFGDRISNKISSKRYPISGSLEVTYRCNLRCKHCYLANDHAGIPGKSELSLSETQRILGEIADAGTLSLLLTGGEPFVRRDFLDIYTHAKKAGLLVTIFTNGTLITEAIADYLAEWRPLKMEITLYGYTQETYEKVTGIPGSHAKCMRGIEMLLEHKIPLSLKTMVLTINQHELWDMKNYAESLGLRFRYDGMINSTLESTVEPLTLRLSPQELVNLELQDPQQVEIWQGFYDAYKDRKPNPELLYSCGAGLRSFHIDPYGQLSLCIMARQPAYNLQTGTFKEGWDEFLAQARNQPIIGENPCHSCELLSICGQCPGWATLEHGDPLKKVEFLCELAHLRADAFDLSNNTRYNNNALILNLPEQTYSGGK
jgi:radical SAM protein with 4Fe4S-binding SPASM domain